MAADKPVLYYEEHCGSCGHVAVWHGIRADTEERSCYEDCPCVGFYMLPSEHARWAEIYRLRESLQELEADCGR